MYQFEEHIENDELIDDVPCEEYVEFADTLDRYSRMLGEYYEDFLVEYRPLNESQLSDADYDLSRLQWEDTIICELVLWLHQLEREMTVESLERTTLQTHCQDKLCSTVGFRPVAPLDVWALEDGRPAISYDEHGPYAILPAGLEVMEIQDSLPISIYLLRYP